MACSPDTPGVNPQEGHLELVGQAIDRMQQETRSLSGTLGNRFSTRYRVFTLLSDYLANHQQDDLFFSQEQREELKLAVDDIFQYPFLASTKYSLGRMMSQRRSPDEIVDYVLEMRKTGTLCNIPPEELRDNRDPQIICSLGIKYDASKSETK